MIEIALIAVLISGIIFLSIDLILLHKDLREVTAEISDKLRIDTNSPISVSSRNRSVRSFASDISAQLQVLHRQRQKLQNGDAELKTAITNVSHDIRTPLTAICGYLDLLEQEPQTEKAVRYLTVIRERTNAMRNLTEELFQYSMLNANAPQGSREVVCINDILEQSLAASFELLVQHGITPDIQLSAQPVLRSLDKEMLLRVFDNILGNAVKYSDGDLQVTLTTDGVISFTNTAPDLTHVQAEQLFDRFFTVSSAGSATGLGLSIAKLLTEKMDGQIHAVYSDGKLCIRVSFSLT